MAEASQLFAETSVYARKKLTGYSCASMLHLFVGKMKALAFWPPFQPTLIPSARPSILLWTCP